MAECYLRTSVVQIPQTVSAESVLRSAATCFPLPWSTCVHLLSVNNENPPVGLILCARKDEVVARYALEGLPNKVMAAEYRTALPDEKTLAAEIRRTQEILRKREAVSLPLWEEIRVKKTAGTKRGAKGTGGKRK